MIRAIHVPATRSRLRNAKVYCSLNFSHMQALYILKPQVVLRSCCTIWSYMHGYIVLVVSQVHSLLFCRAYFLLIVTTAFCIFFPLYTIKSRSYLLLIMQCSNMHLSWCMILASEIYQVIRADFLWFHKLWPVRANDRDTLCTALWVWLVQQIKL